MRRRWSALAVAPRIRSLDLGPIEHVPLGRARVVWAGGRRLAVHRTRRGDVFATDDRCPQHGESLEGSVVAGRMVLCPGHGYAFNLSTGRCVGGVVARLRTYTARVTAEGRVEVDLE